MSGAKLLFNLFCMYIYNKAKKSQSYILITKIKFYQGEREHWTVNYTGAQSFINLIVGFTTYYFS